MPTDRAEAIEALLIETERSHGRYEATELNGVYDQDWPRWYAAYAVDHGIGSLLGHDVAPDRLADLLASINAEFEQLERAPDESWSTYAAERLSQQL